MMKIICSNHLTGPQKEQLAQLARICQEAEALTLSCPLDGDMFCLLTEGKELLGALAVFFQENVWECYAFTRPDRRREGCFSQLLERLETEAEKLEADPEFCFITDGNSADGLKTLEAIGAEFWYAEHAMVWERPDTCEEADSPARTAFAQTAPSCTALSRPDRSVRLKRAADPSQPSLYHFTALNAAGAPAGCFSLYIQGSSASLFHVEVPQPLRGQGWGTAIICALLDTLPSMNISRLVLQVSGSNAPAISLYKKTGFRITETLSYYLY